MLLVNLTVFLYFSWSVIAANFTKPEVTEHQCDDSHWLVSCSSHGGLPKAKMMWNVDESLLVNIVNSSENPDPDTQTWNCSSTAFFNCSRGEITEISCTVGTVTSEIFSVCKSKKTRVESQKRRKKVSLLSPQYTLGSVKHVNPLGKDPFMVAV